MESAAIFRTLAENALDIVCLHDPDGRYIYVRPSCKRILGYDPERLIGENPYDLVHPEDTVRLQQQSHPRVLEGKDAVVTCRIRKSSGDYIWFESTNRPIVGADGIVRQVVSVSREIYAREKTNDELSKEYAVSSSAVGIAMSDLEGNLFYANPAFLKMWGVANSRDIIGKNILDLASNKETAAEGLKAVKESGSWSADAVIRRTDGSSFNEHIVTNLVKDAGGRPCCMMASILDTTERARMEEVLRDSEEKFRTLAELSPNMIFIYQMGRIVYANRRCEEILGYSRPELYSPEFDFMSIIASEYQDKVKESFSKHLEGGEMPSYEYALLSKAGGRIDAIVNTKLILFGGRHAILGTLTDITWRKKAEKELEEHRDKLEARVKERTAEVAEMNERLKILSRRLIETQENERSNLARELHDQIGQSLNMIKILLDRFGSAGDSDRLRFQHQATGILTDLIDRVSDLSLELRPRILDDLGLVRALEWYFSRFTRQTNIRVQFKPSDIDELPLSITNSIYRVVQEALTNVARHAGAKSVIVKLKYERGKLQLSIEDNGVGFSPAAVNTNWSGGIIGMKERIGLLGGILQIESEPAAGTRVIAEIPYRIYRRGKGTQMDDNHINSR